MDIPKEWIQKAALILGEVQEILAKVRETAEKIETVDRDLTEIKKLVEEIKVKSKALMDKVPPWILEAMKTGGKK